MGQWFSDLFGTSNQTQTQTQTQTSNQTAFIKPILFTNIPVSTSPQGASIASIAPLILPLPLPLPSITASSSSNINTYAAYMAMMSSKPVLVSSGSWSSIMNNALSSGILTTAIPYQTYLNLYQIFLNSISTSANSITTYSAFINNASRRQLTCSEWASVCSSSNGLLNITYDEYIKQSYGI